MILGALLAGAADVALAKVPDGTIRPRRRGDGAVRAAATPVAQIVEAARLDGAVSFVVADAVTGEVLEAFQPNLPQPPASTAKALTTLYGIDKLGLSHRFVTQVVGTGPIINGRLEGDLILVGGGDPGLDTRALGAMAKQLKRDGLREVAGHFRLHNKALPEIYEIDPEQPDHVAYNPGVGALNLNYNRVHFEWKRAGTGYEVGMGAPAVGYAPEIAFSTMEVVDRSAPIYTLVTTDTRDAWTVAKTALGSGGSRWLPVRKPALYTGEVFQTVVQSLGIMMQGAILPAQSAEGTVLARHESAPLSEILKDMLEYSTNATAEIVGLSASSKAFGASVPGLRQSAALMNDWLNDGAGPRGAVLTDHSGLGDDSRISAADMARAMVLSGYDGELRQLMKPFRVVDDNSIKVDAKTGTLNFVSALTGYVARPGRTPLAFAIFCSDVERREALAMEQRERPEGGRAWLGRARTLQRRLLRRWATIALG
ncbi:D-alanyl-D-alanine carboxypeptidase/D-alanyl-D-alanine endopeptidase [Profundibacterium mesophilum]|nr:D-alanyl-D-alanine carboxypeptidase/D-alanyl-D-alanine-endopeptidase [Profundibacterium mesophilum]